LAEAPLISSVSTVIRQRNVEQARDTAVD
jgi:hypothetical protein